MAHVRSSLWESGHDESVEVNQRALIDKVLARYSGEFTVFRELLQNSDDASAKAVEIHFETEAFLQRQNAKDSGESNGDGIVSKPGTEKLPDLKTAVVHQWSFKNDGIIFRDEDWSRLKKIAEGNPDEEKIGAFGVGFYSLFSVTEEPFVTSGGQWMGFYWKDKKDQLFARRGDMPEDQHSVWTSFCMPLREPGPIPTPFDFIRFLASSITFMARLSEVSVFFDGKRLAKLDKTRGIPRAIGLRKGLKPETQKGTMRVTDISVTSLSIKAEVMQWVYSVGSTAKPRKRPNPPQLESRKAVSSGFFSALFSFGAASPRAPPAVQIVPSEEDDKHKEEEENKKLWDVHKTSVVLAIFSADVAVTLEDRMRKELLRATKKNPPSKMKYELIYTGKEEYDSSKKEEAQSPLATGSVFQGLRADIDGTGSARVFIGHSTGQTTGIGGHMSARFIPTVERESIDFVDRNVRVWNEELLGVGAYLARSAYEEEMYDISSIWDVTAGKTDPEPTVEQLEARKNLQARALHALKFFTFHASTPSSQVSTVLEEAFFSCVQASLLSYWSGGGSSHPFPIMSTVGIRGAADVRLPNATFKVFLKKLPMLPQEIMDGAGTMVEALRSRELIKEIKFDDVLKELKDRPLSEEEMIACFKWWIDLYKVEGGARLEPAQKQLLNAAILMLGTPGGADEKHVPIASIESVLNSRNASVHIPTDGPLPVALLPLNISRHFDPTTLCSSFGWKEFTIIQWLEHILAAELRAQDVEHDVTRSAVWAERVLTSLSRAWPSLAKTTTQRVVELLRDLSCIPTSAGLKRPAEAYFQNAHVFPDLPLIKLPSGTIVKGPLEKLLETLGVRKHVELQLVFNRMIKTREWSIYDLVKYLVAVQTTLSPEELERLRMTAAFPKEQSEKATQNSKGDAERFRANQLYEPLDEFRELGLPLIDWGVKNKWKSGSEEAKFLFRLGLLRYPPLDIVVNLAAGSDEHVRRLALKYLLDNRMTKYIAYTPQTYAKIAFIPAIKNGKPTLANPDEVFANKEWSTMRFSVASNMLSADDLRKLGVKESPPPPALVNALVNNPPESEELAQRWFALLAGHITDFTPRHLQTLSSSLIVPVKPPKDASDKSTIRMLTPKQCYFRSASSTQEVHSKLFTFVDFGSPANQFLSACGTKHEPTVEEIAQILLENPRNFYQISQGRDNYLFELRNFAVNRRQLSSGTIARMKRAPIFLGSRRVKRTKTKASKESAEFEDEDDWEYQWDLLTPEKVVIADDTNAEHLFGDAIFSCPQEDLLEDFYREMGSRRLSSLIKQEQKTTAEIRNTQKAVGVRTLILERLPLFLHEHTQTSQARVPYSWLNQDKNFVVRTFGKLTVNKVLTYNETRIVKNQDTSAVAFREGRGPIELWLAGNDAVDMYEVSTSMCKLLFEQPRAADALLFMTILSTDLKALRRRGYNVDRILQKQQAQRQAAQDAARQHAEQMALLPHDAPPTTGEKSGAQVEPLSSNAAPCDPPNSPRSQNGVRGSLDTWKKRLTGKFGSHDMPGLPGGLPEIHENGQPAQAPENVPEPSGSLLTPPRPTPSRPSTPGITPTQNISANINMAIRACREERGSLLQSKREMKIVKESLNDSYCDITGSAVDMVLAGDMGGFKVFMARDIQQPKVLMAQKRESIARFIHIIQRLANIYNLPHSSLHVFFDNSGETIAFNRNASLFCNLRFFEAWHDEQVKAGILSKAFISWYFTLAHEIAHNLVQPHNAEHEFWFSSLCEEYLPKLGTLLASCDP